MKDSQANSYILTINNPSDKGYSHEKIREVLKGIPQVAYWCLCDEIGMERHTPHTHLYFHSKIGIRFSTLQNRFPHCDIRKSLGTPQQCRDYIRKEGAYVDSSKAESNLIETFEEWGELPVPHQGKRNDLEEIYALIKEGHTNSEIISAIGSPALRHIDLLDKLRFTYLRDRYRTSRRLDLKVNYVFGITGSGKSRDILNEFGDDKVYRVTDYEHPFDSYQCEPVLCFEEFRSSLRLQDMLNYLDVYPVTLPARYAPKIACFSTVFLVSNWNFEAQYAEIQKDPLQKSTYAAFVRRFNGYVKHYTENGIIIYPSMSEYLNRESEFLSADNDTDNPFI